jgi:hypothetical protein
MGATTSGDDSCSSWKELCPTVPHTREKVEPMTRRRLLLGFLAFATIAAACNSDGNPGPDTTFAAEMASSWHFAGAPQRVQVGILGSDANGVRFVTQGSIELRFAYLGPDGSATAEPGPTATATFVPVPGTKASGTTPTLTGGTRGVYQAEDVTFDRPGVWQATLHLALDGVAQQLRVTFPVTAVSAIPAPGQRAPRTQNLTIDSTGVSETSIDSMAVGGGGIPDPELHEWTIADAVDQGRPALVLFGTPAYCESRFCGPEVTELQRLAAEFPDRAVYIHIEIWKDHDAQVVNRAAADWLLVKGKDGSVDLIEPYLFLIGADGRIADRWGPLFDPAEVEADLEALPPMKS